MRLWDTRPEGLSLYDVKMPQPERLATLTDQVSRFELSSPRLPPALFWVSPLPTAVCNTPSGYHLVFRSACLSVVRRKKRKKR
jgi:hypothetical protein